MMFKFVWPVCSAIITVSLFLLMGYLITPHGDIFIVDEPPIIIDISRKTREEKTEEKLRNKPVKPKPPKAPPKPLVEQSKPVVTASPNALSGSLPSTISDDDFTFSKMDRRATPVVRIPPEYPQGPLGRGIEGWVLVEFTITSTGTVEDAKVIDGEPVNVFNQAALRAIKRWKYQPQVADGKAVAQYNMQEMFKFEIDSSK